MDGQNISGSGKSGTHISFAGVVLPFKIEVTDETLTANAGLVLFGEFIYGLGFKR